ncbi:AIM23 [Candida theae]|uniref:Altered inheritance of mitochondria protein 23, mitochondrial n=1 Tax=Candida theae TaxID=1198502 RepID=A0AAD5FW15_9ASCO|nr:AIM23 [Candida theae]KAI5948702.1 AIM23 [Candida theae]
MSLLHSRLLLQQRSINKRLIATTTKLCSSNNSSNNYNTFISKTSNTESKPSSSNRFQEHYSHRNNRYRPVRNNHSHHNRRDKPLKTHTNDTFDLQKIFNTGSETAQNALKSILSRIHQLQPLNQQVQYVSPTQGLITCSIQQVLEGLDLSIHGLQLIEREASNNNNNKHSSASASASTTGSIPLIKRIKIQEMLKSYNDELAEAKELELLTMGSKKTIKALDNKLRAKQKKSSEKQIMIKWSISLNDLTNQKKVEIDNRLRKEKSKIVIYLIHNKKSPNLKITDIFRNNNSDESVDEMMEIELKRRDKVKSSLEEILNSLDCKWTMEGDVESKVVYSITPTASSPVKETVEKSQVDEVAKSQKKKKPRTNEVKSKSKAEDEEDLDALYSFKIED